MGPAARVVVCAALVSFVGGGVATAGTAGAAAATPAARAARPASAGLEQSWTSATGTWAVVAMGHYDEPRNTFWQVLFRPAGSARWTLVTPPGVASNGGFSADGLPGSAGTSGTVTAGFQPSVSLTYSPIAQTSDDGKRWSAGTLPTGLLPVADAVADGAGGVVLALVRSKGGTLVRADGSLTIWKPVVTRRALDATAAGRDCGVEAFTAVAGAAGPRGSPELGASCATPGVVGLFHVSSGRWLLTAVRLRGLTGSTFTVLRLQGGASGTSAIVEARDGHGASLVALWRRGPSATWEASSPVRLQGTVLSTASTGGTAFLVVTGSGFHARGLLWIGAPRHAWRSLGPPPPGTQVVVAAPSAVEEAGALGSEAGPGELSALEVSGSDVRVWERAAGGAWRRTAQRFDVPIEYGSST